MRANYPRAQNAVGKAAARLRRHCPQGRKSAEIPVSAKGRYLPVEPKPPSVGGRYIRETNTLSNICTTEVGVMGFSVHVRFTGIYTYLTPSFSA